MEVMTKKSFVQTFVVIFVVYSMISEVSAQVEVCRDDQECVGMRSCGEASEFVRTRNHSELRKIKVCGAKSRMEICCKKDLSNHQNFHLINHKRCGIIVGDRIFGGETANVAQFRWMALLRYQPKTGGSELSFMCGGSLITKFHVLTAAHCLQSRDSNLHSVRLGEHTISTEIDCDDPEDEYSCVTSTPLIQDIEVESTIAHPNYDTKTKLNDIGLVKLTTAAVFQDVENVGTICLPVEPHQLLANTPVVLNHEELVTIAGWGKTETSDGMSDVLMRAFVPYLTNEVCAERFIEIKRKFKAITFNIHESHLCAGGLNASDTCKGDSGGPLFYPSINGQTGKRKMFQYGVVAAGISCSRYGPTPSIYTRVSHFMFWILDNISA